jgi:hypothetical protein
MYAGLLQQTMSLTVDTSADYELQPNEKNQTSLALELRDPQNHALPSSDFALLLTAEPGRDKCQFLSL